MPTSLPRSLELESSSTQRANHLVQQQHASIGTPHQATKQVSAGTAQQQQPTNHRPTNHQYLVSNTPLPSTQKTHSRGNTHTAQSKESSSSPEGKKPSTQAYNINADPTLAHFPALPKKRKAMPCIQALEVSVRKRSSSSSSQSVVNKPCQTSPAQPEPQKKKSHRPLCRARQQKKKKKVVKVEKAAEKGGL
ncbi:uncharacterized protein K452DRAFT_42118 [Aplosporella prunicola CBS 121167]|uniref:Uncharacterized protein n=1 Tax=Aplosporella prunicola CBS 121167 TaxID=1176127 RepID=A0A6A6B9I0_9PEZI|nr:uncharacterized protein K452DRAFT_42118 [Aplosporella prunicola CBS 121167]KAF2140869.1 hypothetical protein K452DRAFT_42118 [Aplosporella prunicola CBS 121167]